jgi:hypothetical protein
MAPQQYFSLPLHPQRRESHLYAVATNSTQNSNMVGRTTRVSANDKELRVILEPIRDRLLKLQAMTKASMPPQHHNLRAKTHLQVIRDRLIPIGEFVIQETKDKANRWEMELKFWYVLTSVSVTRHFARQL